MSLTKGPFYNILRCLLFLGYVLNECWKWYNIINFAIVIKDEILREVQEVGNVSLVARRHGVSKSTIFTWIKNSKAKDEIKVKPGRKTLIGGEKELESELTEVTKENDQLKKLLGEKDLEIAILKDLIKKANPQLKIK